MRDTYIFYRSLESFLKLRGELVLRREAMATDDVSYFMGFDSSTEFLKYVEGKRVLVQEIRKKYL